MTKTPPPQGRFEDWVSASAMRSRVVLEIAAELVTADDQPMRQARVLLREQGNDGWPLALHAGSTLEAIDQVVSGKAQLSMVNPAAILTMAYRGTGPFTAPQPVRVIAVIPSLDQLVFAVRASCPLETFEDIGRRRFALKASVRDQKDHCIHLMLEHTMRAAGFSPADIAAWGGTLRNEVRPRKPRYTAYESGAVDAIFDEAVDEWGESALARGMKFLPLAEETLVRLEAMGYRRGTITPRVVPSLKAEVPTLDFSGWPIYVRADLPDRQVAQICAALDARKHLIPWQGSGPLPVERMCRDAPDTPLDVPLHPAAEAFWRAQGYIS
jgi:TRAP-type uncharacterized transport system substrate-binding protein